MHFTYPSHYQPLLPPAHTDIHIDDAMDLEDLLFTISDLNTDIEIKKAYLRDTKKNPLDTWAIVEFSDSLSLFPTARTEDLGAIVSYTGKTYYIWFDEDFKLNIGVDGVIYCYENSTYLEDYGDAYNMIFC